MECIYCSPTGMEYIPEPFSTPVGECIKIIERGYVFQTEEDINIFPVSTIQLITKSLMSLNTGILLL